MKIFLMEVRPTRYDSETAELIRVAGRKAGEMGHSYVGSAHLLLAMIRNRGFAGNILRGFGLNGTVAEDMTVILYGKGTPRLPLPQGLTTELQGILRGAAREARNCGVREISVKHLLLALTRQEGSDAEELLHFNGIAPAELFNAAVEQTYREGKMDNGRKKGAVVTKLLEQFGEDLVLKAGSMEPVVSRDREIDTVIGILCRKIRITPHW